MLTIIFALALIWVAGKFLVFGIKAAWGIAKIFWTVILLPVAILVLFVMGFVYLAIPLLIIGAIVAIVRGRSMG